MPEQEHDPNTADPALAESLRRSNPNATGAHRLEGGMGVSSERVGHVAPGEESTDGMRDVSPLDAPDPDAPPEQSAGGVEENPVGLEPKAGYPKADPRSPS